MRGGFSSDLRNRPDAKPARTRRPLKSRGRARVRKHHDTGRLSDWDLPRDPFLLR